MADIKGWFFKVKCMMIYLITEPFIQIKIHFYRLGNSTDKLARPRIWFYIFLFFFVFSTLARNFYAAWAFLVLLVITGLKYIWDRGKYMERYYKRKGIHHEKWNKIKK